jgi:hypothetical protein
LPSAFVSRLEAGQAARVIRVVARPNTNLANGLKLDRFKWPKPRFKWPKPPNDKSYILSGPPISSSSSLSCECRRGDKGGSGSAGGGLGGGRKQLAAWSPPAVVEVGGGGGRVGRRLGFGVAGWGRACGQWGEWPAARSPPVGEVAVEGTRRRRKKTTPNGSRWAVWSVVFLSPRRKIGAPQTRIHRVSLW